MSGGVKENADYASGNLIVNYLPQTMSRGELYNMFVTLGPLQSCRVMKDSKTNYSYGFGFVNYKYRADAEKAIQQLNGLEILNKRLKVSFARPSSEKIKKTNLYITNIPRTFNADNLKALFEPYGMIVQMNLLKDKSTGMPRGVAFIRFHLNEEAENAIANLNGKSVDGSAKGLSVRVAEEHGKQKAAYYFRHQNGSRGSGGNNSGVGAMKQERIQQRFNPMTFGFSPMNSHRTPQPFSYRGRNLNRRYRTNFVQTKSDSQENTQQRLDPMTFGFSPMNGPLVGYRGQQGHNFTRQNGTDFVNTQIDSQENTQQRLDTMTFGFSPMNGPLVGYRGQQGHNFTRQNGTDFVNTQIDSQENTQQRLDTMTFGFSPMNGPLVGYRGQQGHNFTRQNGTDFVNTQIDSQENTQQPWDPMNFGFSHCNS